METLKNILFSTRVKIIIAMLLGLVAMNVIRGQQVFLAESPTLNPFFIARVQNLPNATSNFVASLGSIFDGSRGTKQTIKEIAVQPRSSLNFVPVAKGVQAAEDPSTGEKFVKLKKGSKVRVVEQVGADGQVTKRIEMIEGAAETQ